MKGIYKIALMFLALCAIFTLASCSNSGNIETTVNVVARNNKITLQASFVDKENGLFSQYTPYAYIYEMDGNNVGDQIESLSFSLDSDESSGNNYVANELAFDDLEEETSYTVRITVTISGRSHTLYDKVVATNDLGTEENPISITNTSEFLAMANDREGYYRLEADLDFTGVEVTPLFNSSSRRFEGGLDGGNHKISNITISSNNQYNGLFGVNAGTIKNLIVENITMTSERTSEMNCGLLVGYSIGVIDNCQIINGTLTAKSTAYTLTYAQNVGGLVGLVGGTREGIAVTNCKLENVTITVDARHKASIGGLIGEISLSTSIRRTQTISGNDADTTITVNQEIKASITDDVNINVGGFAGLAASYISNSVATSDITVKTVKASSANYENGLKNYTLAVGGFVGTTYDNINRAFETVAFFGSIDVDATEVYTTYVAGLVAVLGNNFKVKDSVVALDALTIKGPVQAEEETPTTEAEGDAETEVTGPTYSLTYGEIFATNVTYDNPDGKVTNVISIKQITPSVTSDYITEIPTNYVALTEAMINDFTNYYVDESGNVIQECVMVKYLNSYLA